jgi:hypothetical protein
MKVSDYPSSIKLELNCIVAFGTQSLTFDFN